MKNQVFLHILFLITLFGYQVQAQQCPSGNIILSTQAEVDNFVNSYPMCQALPGGILIGTASSNNLSDITDLSGLQLTSVGGDLTIQNNAMLTNLNSFSMLTTVNGGLKIFNNDGLTILSGLESLTSIGKNLSILNNDGLINVTGLSGLTSIGTSLNISFNSMLNSLMGLEGITAIPGFLNIESNGITSMAGLDNLEAIGGDFDIRNNLSLLNFGGLEDLTFVGGSFYIFYNLQLTTIEALSSLVDICGQFQLFKNDALTACAIPIMCVLTQDPNFDLFIETFGAECGSSAQIMAQVQAANIDCVAAEAASVLCDPLSAELVSLDIRLEGRTAVLQWETATETNNQGFEIQRSKDGINWQTIAWQEGSGTSNTSRGYTYTDYNTYRGINYYRLQQVDFSGTFAYSQAVSITTNDVNTIDVYPNPASDFLVVSGLDGRTIEEIVIHNIAGKEVVRLNNVDNIIDISNLQPGMYVAVIITGFDEKFIKLIIE